MKTKASKIYTILNKEFSGEGIELNFKTPLQCMVAVILSAQCTDKRVNEVTKKLFKKYRKAKDYAEINQIEFEKDIKSTGFYKNKAKNIRAACKKIVEEHNGKVPKKYEELIKLPGVGRKSANAILGAAYGISSGIVVDTHVRRVSNRLGLTKNNSPEKIADDLEKIVPKRNWIRFAHLIILHGRRVCTARNPKCKECPLLKLCPFGQERMK